MNIELNEEQKIKVQNAFGVYTIMKEILMRENALERDHEHVWVLSLANNNKILNIELVSLGAINETTLQPMQVFRIAIMKGAVRLIMVHNHPDGELEPSEGDKDVTDRMIQVGNIVDVEVLDHLIISPVAYYSFKDHGLMNELRHSTKWVPTFVEIERIKKEALKLGEKKGLKAGKKLGEQKKAEKIARKSLKEGLSIEITAKITGLSVEEINKIKNQACQKGCVELD